MLPIYVFMGGGEAAPPPAVPVVVGIDFELGDPLGGLDVVIEVVDSTGATGATIGGVALTGFAIDDGTHVSGTTGAHAAGLVDIVVTNGGGDSAPLVNGFEYWDPTVAGVTSYFRKPDYAVAGGTGTWAASVGSNIAESALEPAASGGAPDLNTGERLQYPAHVGTLFGAASATGGTYAAVIDLDAFLGGAADCIMGNSAFTFAVVIEPGLVLNFYYKSGGTYKTAGPVSIPSSGRIALVARRNSTGTAFVELTVDGGANWAASAAVGDLDTPTSDLFLGNNGTYSLNALFLASMFNTDQWSDADVDKFHRWQAVTFP